MNPLDRAIAALAPGWALRRQQARIRLNALYEAAAPSRLRKQRNDASSADAVVNQAGSSLRMTGRYFDENYDIAKGVLTTLVNNTVGRGIAPEPQVRTTGGELHKEFNELITQLWNDWVLKPDVTWEHHYYSAQRLMCRSFYRDGEVLQQFIDATATRIQHGTRVPFSIEMIEADFLPYDFIEDQRNIIQGVQKNQWGRPTAYHLLKRHPGALSQLVTFNEETKRVPADRMLHLKLTDRIRQTRGVSIFASVITRLEDIKDYEESERVAARVAAAMAAAIKKGSPDLYEAPDNSDTYRELEMTPGMIFDDLEPGESIEMIESKRPNTNLQAFRDSQMRAVAAGTSTNYSSIAKNYQGSYSSQRQELTESNITYGVLRDFWVERQARPTYNRFLLNALLGNIIRAPSDVNRDTLMDADFGVGRQPWIDPQKEISADKLAIESGIKTRSQVIRERGGSPTQVAVQRELELEQDAELRQKGWLPQLGLDSS